MVLLLSIYCKSYRTDLKRVIRLAKSIQSFNTERIPFYVSVPQSDIALFRGHLSDYLVEVIEDEMILARTPYASQNILEALPGHITQQLVKSEFWRLGISKTYLCVDSDAIFIRPFGFSDFICRGDTPYTVIDECHEYLEACLQSGKSQALAAFTRESAIVRNMFERPGKEYAFGPFPLIWHHAVWESLESEYLHPRRMTLVDAIKLAPLESRWYGESLLKYQAIPLIPCQPFFKVYHYAWQLDNERRASVTTNQLAMIYSGVIYQSAWEREMDWPREGGSALSRWARHMRRHMGKV